MGGRGRLKGDFEQPGSEMLGEHPTGQRVRPPTCLCVSARRQVNTRGSSTSATVAGVDQG